MPAYKYKLKNGKVKWYANFYYNDWMGEKQHKCKRGFETKKAAQEYERLFLDKYSKNPTILFSSLVTNYMEDMSSRLKPTTMKSKQYLIDTKILPTFGTVQACDIDADMVRRWQNSLINYTDEDGNPYAPTYLHAIHSQLSAIFNYAVKYYNLQRNPCLIAGSIGESRATEMKFWTQETFTHAIEYEKKDAYRIAFKILFYSGIREGEALALTPEDIPRKESLIDVNKNYAVVDGIEYFLTPKTDRSMRKVTIPESLHEEILGFIDGMCLAPGDRIFYFQKSGLYEEFKRMISRSGNERIRVHDLRHSHASMLINMGVPIEAISRRLGHDSIKTTWDTYSHLYPGTDKELAKKIEVLINQEKKGMVPAAIPENIDVDIVEGSPLGRASQYLLSEAEKQSNEHIRKNNRNIFGKYGIDIDSEMVYGYRLASYLDMIAFGDSIIKIISSFNPTKVLKDFVISLFTDSVSSCEMVNGSIENLDKFMVETTIPRYSKFYGINI